MISLKHIKIKHYKYGSNIWVIDNFLPEDLFDNCVKEFNTETFLHKSIPNTHISRWECRNFDNTPNLEYVNSYLQSTTFLNLVTNTVGRKDIITDPLLEGAGLCKIEPGQALSVHKDWTWNERIKCASHLGLVLYLNNKWDESWGGHLEFWQNTKLGEIKCKPNRLIFWDKTTEVSHGFDGALSSPIARQTLLQFYFVNETPDEKLNSRTDNYAK